MPDIAEVARCAVCEERESGGFLLIQLLIMLDWA